MPFSAEYLQEWQRVPFRALARMLLGLALLGASPAPAQPVSDAPFPALETGMHTAIIKRFAVDGAGTYGVSASDDKTARVWDLASGRLVQTLRVPMAGDQEGKLYAVAISPDGERVAVGGWTGPTGSNSVYLFERASGRLVGRIAGLPNVINHLAWSPDGQRLAIALFGNNGIRLHAATPPHAEIARDSGYGNDSYSVDFDRSGRVVSTSYDGKLRLYDPALRPIVPPRALTGGTQPFFARFSPDGRRIAVGFNDSTAVHVVSGADLAPLQAMDTSAARGGDLSRVSWSADGRRVFAAGRNQLADGQNPVRVFDPDSGRSLAAWPVSTNTLMDLQPLAGGRLLFASQDPTWGVVDAAGRVLQRQDPPVPDHRGNFDDFRVSRSGDRLTFRHATWQQGRWQRQTLGFDLRRLQLAPADALPAADLAAPRRDGLPMQENDWRNTLTPTLAGRRLALEEHETSRSLAVAADARHFALGTGWYVRWFDAQGTESWARPVPDAAWLVNATRDGRFVVAALGDGTIRWYRTGDQGSEALALFVHADGRRWVAWTPEGFFAASPDGEELMGYVLNQGRDREAEFVSAAQLREAFYRPDLIARRIDGDEAAIRAALAEVGDVRQLLAAGLPPQVELLSEKDPVIAAGADYELKIRITPRQGGVGRLSLRVNGAEQDAGRAEVPTAGVYSVRLRQPPGTHPVQVAIGAAGNRLLSQPVSFNLTVQGVAAKPRLHVLAVGISQYYDPALREGVGYAASDAAAMVDKLRRHADTEVVDLAPPQLLRDPEATKERIEAALDGIARAAQPQDLVVLFLAGHGTEHNGDYYFQPWEARYTSREKLLEQSLSGENLRGRLRSIKANKALVLLDTCASATFQIGAAARSGSTKDAVNRFATLSGRAVISASAGKAREHAELSHGLFTEAVLRGLAGAAANAEGRVTVSGLADFVGDEVEKNALRLFREPQLPQAEFVKLNNFTVTRRR